MFLSSNVSFCICWTRHILSREGCAGALNSGRGGGTLPQPLGPPAAAELSNGARGFSPLGHTAVPCPRFPQPALGKAAGEGQALTTPCPCVLGSLLSPSCWHAVAAAPGPGLQGEGAMPGTCLKPLRSLVSVQKYSESCSVPGSRPFCPLLPCPPAWPVPSPPLPWPPVLITTSILSAPGAPVSWGGLRGRAVPAVLPRDRLPSFPAGAIAELLPRRALRPVSCCPLRGALGHAEAVPECEALGVSSPGTTGNSFLPFPCPSWDFSPAQSWGRSATASLSPSPKELSSPPPSCCGGNPGPLLAQ